jgi:hypothetical protein
MQPPTFDKCAFAGRRTKAVSAETKLSFADFKHMHVQRHVTDRTLSRRLPTPDWARSDEQLKEVVMQFCEDRFYIRTYPDSKPLTYEQRMTRLDAEAKRRLPGKKANLKFLLEVYSEAKNSGAPESVLESIAIQVQNKDTECVVDERGVLAIALSVFYNYYRLGQDSVTVAEGLGLRSPHIRIWLLRANSIANGTGKDSNYKQSEHVMVRYWAKPRLQYLFAMVTGGKTFQEVADVMGTTQDQTKAAWEFHFGNAKKKSLRGGV